MSFANRAEMDAADAHAEKMAKPFDVPNLDDFSVDQMDYAALERTLNKLALYIHDKRMAMKHRLGGDIEAALSYEKANEATYQRLPQWARW